MKLLIALTILPIAVLRLEADSLYHENFEKGSQSSLKAYNRQWRYVPEKLSEQVAQSFALGSDIEDAPEGSSRHLAIRPAPITPPGKLSVQYSPWQREHTTPLANASNNRWIFDLYIGSADVERPLLQMSYLMNDGLDQVVLAFRQNGAVMIAPRRNASFIPLTLEGGAAQLPRQQWHRVVMTLLIPEGGAHYAPHLEVFPLVNGEPGDAILSYTAPLQTPHQSSISTIYGFRVTVDTPEPSETPASFGVDHLSIESANARP